MGDEVGVERGNGEFSNSINFWSRTREKSALGLSVVLEPFESAYRTSIPRFTMKIARKSELFASLPPYVLVTFGRG